MPPTFTPPDDAVVLQPALRASDPSLQALAVRRAAWLAAPGDAAIAEAYARAAINEGRRRADPRYFGYAEAALAHWEAKPEAPVPIVWLQATLLQQRHDFEPAAALLVSLLQRDPEYAPARLTLASIRLVQGKPQEAQRDCAALASRGALTLATTCVAATSSLMGRSEAALSSLDAIQPQLAAAPAEERLWSLTLAAEIAARLDRDDEALRRYRFALQAARDTGFSDPYLRVAYADFLLDRKQPQAVVELLADDLGNDNALLRLAIAQRRLPGHEDRAQQLTSALEARYAAVRERGEKPHAREEAMLQLNLRQNPDRALALALDNWGTQREVIDARLVLESALAAAQPAAARPVTQWIHQIGITDPRLLRLTAQLEAGS